jgi:hypothetical protein
VDVALRIDEAETPTAADHFREIFGKEKIPLGPVVADDVRERLKRVSLELEKLKRAVADAAWDADSSVSEEAMQVVRTVLRSRDAKLAENRQQAYLRKWCAKLQADVGAAMERLTANGTECLAVEIDQELEVEEICETHASTLNGPVREIVFFSVGMAIGYADYREDDYGSNIAGAALLLVTRGFPAAMIKYYVNSAIEAYTQNHRSEHLAWLHAGEQSARLIIESSEPKASALFSSLLDEATILGTLRKGLGN